MIAGIQSSCESGWRSSHAAKVHYWQVFYCRLIAKKRLKDWPTAKGATVMAGLVGRCNWKDWPSSCWLLATVCLLLCCNYVCGWLGRGCFDATACVARETAVVRGQFLL